MYKLETYIREDRIPYMTKTEICNEKVNVNSPEKVFEMLNTYFNLGLRSEEYVYMISMDNKCNVIGIAWIFKPVNFKPKRNFHEGFIIWSGFDYIGT